MTTIHQGRFESAIKELSALFIEKNTEGALASVSSVDTISNPNKITVFITVLPEEKEEDIMKQLQEKTWTLRKFLGEQIKTRRVAEVEIALDPGRKTRLLIDQLSYND
ncbi:hypothetical protein A2645_00675 [Candidatus Nomurabacteria bacterium RIFCSPHIGHO2_01_FULL_39_9]|uniref:Ribosome-binding factor A n=1 Tax=Candidatus Nomurabacteria bacterium RIFCSPHIGHO2_01_FULL_39_9 TaxID=1801735 RepID=A0A1F6UXS9_9BACT|nr:MAG: hypothetical protein A2645_00675 [Candidatus Nomurabacteria bacterium RIFCSPHIGHO2_01_FULL_39_9]